MKTFREYLKESKNYNNVIVTKPIECTQYKSYRDFKSGTGDTTKNLKPGDQLVLVQDYSPMMIYRELNSTSDSVCVLYFDKEHKHQQLIKRN